ncbi:enoyl-CoA hydratase/isomerase family protein [Metabacillus litoralis]|jgi:2-(1,2-epoxy-1,2-dihydrophenyl)acetyl-CoA isomerase|uniref:enoyl-CoA hydratase/isomerase family protein n=1 Tax=Metabacillus litoralis TaxID=152268 RepID=UPI002041B582|nr:enoyl-CoA hydratase-related protein [Metabacillus litoralis]MCM3653333.1 enoyl-CoA hydratase-related protein [Metabacillus litoralis]
MTTKHIIVDDFKGVRNIILNRPEALNSLNYDVIQELENTINESKYNETVRVVVIKGNGKAFCAGDDLKGMGTEKQPVPDHILRRAELGYGRLILALRQLDKPVIAEVHGYALGAGCDLALACDMIFAAENTKFGLVFAKRGLVSGTALLPKLIGYQKACQYLFTGDYFSADEAKELGIVNELHKPEELSFAVDQMAEKLAVAPTAAIGLIKRAMNESIGASLQQSVNIQNNVVAASYSTHDYHEGKKAFQEKREPVYFGK